MTWEFARDAEVMPKTARVLAGGTGTPEVWQCKAERNGCRLAF